MTLPKKSDAPEDDRDPTLHQVLNAIEAVKPVPKARTRDGAYPWLRHLIP